MIAVRRLTLFCILIYPLGMGYGISGTSLAAAIPVLLFAWYSLRAADELLSIGLRKQFESVKIPLLASALMASLLLACQALIPGPGIVRLGLSTAIGATSYILFILFLNREIVDEIKTFLEHTRS
jgi:hypothetical protein